MLRNGNGTVRGTAPSPSGGDGPLRRARAALRQVLGLRREHARSCFQRLLWRSAMTLASAIALGALTAAGAIALVFGGALWLITAAGWSAWTLLLLAGCVLLLAAAALAVAAHRWHRQPAGRDELPDPEAVSLAAAEQAARTELADSLSQGVRLFASPLGLLLAFGGGFAALRAIHKRPRLVRSLLRTAVRGGPVRL